MILEHFSTGNSGLFRLVLARDANNGGIFQVDALLRLRLTDRGTEFDARRALEL